jgi:hypothetical protein
VCKIEKTYDACLRITDLESLQREIFESGRIRELDCGISDVFLRGLIQPVKYEPRSRDIREGPVMEPSPFKKAERFKGQSEVRILFEPNEGNQIAEQKLTIEIPKPTEFFAEMFRNYRRDDITDTVPAS